MESKKNTQKEILAEARKLTAKSLANIRLAAPANLSRLGFPGLKKLLLEVEAPKEDLEALARLEAAYKRLKAEEATSTKSPRHRRSDKHAADEATGTTSAKTKKRKWTMAKIGKWLATAVAVVWLAGGVTNAAGLAVQVAIVFLAIKTLLNTLGLKRAKGGSKTPRAHKSLEERIKDIGDLPVANVQRWFAQEWNRWSFSGGKFLESRLPATTIALCGAYTSLQLVHAADGDPASWARFITNPNWLMVASAPLLMLGIYWLVSRMAKGDFSPLVSWVICVVTVVVTVAFAMGGQWLVRNQVTAPIHTVQ